ncbi:histidine kinase [Desulfocapsa sulfexigens DSM 10523]|uniref:histidine kinase n=1 Tax=Desulfocapsa sulfexigens (strain DSM 10523 / SB164P1) TaxID=1167006 RepID=M1P631_DESSD|nr:ATP-binding protein [Desulfocapsa sulfexigens]AGF78918.1 histidine kinase [Desulfocapsa sulfexigens DSM 10523]
MINSIKNIKRSYNARILLLFIGGMVVLAIGLDLLFINIQRKSYTRHTRQSGLATARLLAQSVQIGVFSELPSAMNPMVDSLLLQDDIYRVVILNNQKEVLLDKHDNQATAGEDDDYLTQLAKVHLEGNHFLDRPHSFVFWWPVMSSISYNDEDDLYFQDKTTAIQEKKHIGWVAISTSKKKFEIEVQQLIIRTGILVATALFLAIFSTITLLNKMMRPLRDLVHKVGDAHGEGKHNDEIDILDNTYSTLLERLEQSFSTIDELRQNLEEKVKVRTEELALANKDLNKKKDTLKKSNASLEKALQESKEAQAQLIHTEKLAALGQLVAGVAHEFNNNINFIVTAAPILGKTLTEIKKITEAYHEAGTKQTESEMLEGLRRAEKLRKTIGITNLYSNIDHVLNSISEGCSRSVKIIQELTSFSRQDSDDFNIFNVNKALLSTWKFVDLRNKNKVQLITEFTEIPEILCTGGKINQVFLNIMNNATQAITDKKGTLTLTTSCDEEMVHIRFADTGSGIEKEDLPRIFDPFFTKKAVGQGTGLGLGICYKIIAQHHGKIRVESGAGVGTAITISLPIHSNGNDRPECELSLISIHPPVSTEEHVI